MRPITEEMLAAQRIWNEQPSAAGPGTADAQSGNTRRTNPTIQASHIATRRLIDTAIDDFPPFPTVASKVLEATDSDHGSASELERVLGADQALSAKILRTANSAYFGMPNRVSNLNQAVMLLGFSQIRSIVVSLAAASLFRSPSAAVRELQYSMWQHAFGTGCAFKLICQRVNLNVTAETAFTGGLMTGIGSLFLAHAFTGQYTESTKISRAKKVSQAEAEEYLFGVNHAMIGASLSTKWNLPMELVTIIGSHEGPFGPDDRLGKAAHAADRIALQITEGLVSSQAEHGIPLAAELELTADTLEEIGTTVSGLIQTTGEFLGLN